MLFSRFFHRCAVPLLSLVLLLPWATVAAQEQTPSEEQALEAYRQGAFSRAVELYTTALTETDDAQHKARLHVQIAWTLFALGREGEVDIHLKAALLEFPSLTLVPDYYTQEFLDLFDRTRQQILAGGSGSDDLPAPDLEATLVGIQERLLTEQDLEGALADIDRLLEAYPTDPRLIPQRIEVLHKLGRTEEAEEMQQLIGATGIEALMGRLSVPDLVLRANRHLEDGDVDTSLELLRIAVSRQPSNVAALELMAEAARRAAHWQEAEYALKSALGLQPDNIGLNLLLGEVYLATDEISAARDVFKRLTERYPHSDRAWAALGLIDAKLGIPERAKVELEKALEENPLLPEVQLAYGELLLTQGKSAEAGAALRSAANLLQEDPQVEARLGQVLLAQGKPEQALEHLKRGVEGGFAPDDVQRSLVLALLGNGLVSEAARTLVPISPDNNGDTQVLESMLQLESQEIEEAERILTPLLQSRSNDPAVLNLIAVSLYRQQRYAEAVQHLRNASSLSPESGQLVTNLAYAEAAEAAVKLGKEALGVKAPPRRR